MAKCLLVYGRIESRADEERARRRATSTTDDNIQQLSFLILDNRPVSVDEMASHIHISHGLASQIIHSKLNFIKVV